MMPQVARASVDETSRQANFAMFAIAAVGVMEALGCVFNDLDVPGILCQIIIYAAWVVAGILYCRWLFRAYGDVLLLQGSSLRFKPREAVVSFFLPFVAFYRPYRALVDLHEASDPRSIRIPSDAGLGARANDWEKLFPSRSWWTLWLLAPLVTGLLDNASVLTHLPTMVQLSDPSAMLLLPQESRGDGLMRVLAALIHLALAALAIAVVRSIVARQRERLRRLEATFASGAS
jgi:hypothetical protein